MLERFHQVQNVPVPVAPEEGIKTALSGHCCGQVVQQYPQSAVALNCINEWRRNVPDFGYFTGWA